MPIEKILVLDDDSLIRELFGRVLHAFSVTSVATVAEAEALVRREAYDLIFCDVRLPDGNGHQFLDRLSVLPERPPVIMITGHGSIESAVSCMRAGAFDYLVKPFTPPNIELLLKRVETARRLVNVNRYLREQNGVEGEIIGRSAPMQRLRQIVARVAPTDATILVTGESGVGKEMVARDICRQSPRRDEAYVQVNCAAVSASLIESEFFGHEKGAFTGASDRREGRFELAHRGTLLLDEVSEIPLNLQAKLLRVLQERQFERVGGNKTIKVNVRILATSNRDLLHFVQAGSFRQDLYYRLNVFPVHVPPLRERIGDITELSDRFLERFSRKHGIHPQGLSDAAREALIGYPWPGNVRELQNTIERAVILTENNRPVSLAALGLPSLPRTVSVPAVLESPPEATSLEGMPATVDEPAAAPTDGATREFSSLEELEQQHILAALRRTNGNRTQAANLLRISLRTLRNKIQAYRAAGVSVDETTIVAA